MNHGYLTYWIPVIWLIESRLFDLLNLGYLTYWIPVIWLFESRLFDLLNPGYLTYWIPVIWLIESRILFVLAIYDNTCNIGNFISAHFLSTHNQDVNVNTEICSFDLIENNTRMVWFISLKEKYPYLQCITWFIIAIHFASVKHLNTQKKGSLIFRIWHPYTSQNKRNKTKYLPQ